MGPLNKKDAELNLVFSIKVNDFDYAVFVNSGTLKCFGGGREGHLVRTRRKPLENGLSMMK